MRILIFNANIITGDGKTILENHSLILDGELIDTIIRLPYPRYVKPDLAINAQNGFVIPGIINHHAHNVTLGPAGNVIGSIPYSKPRVLQNLRKHLLDGTTTIVNVDGMATQDEVAEARSLTPMLVQTMSTHTPLYLENTKRLNLGGMKKEHWLRVEDRIKQGAVGIGEVGGAQEDMPPYRRTNVARVVEEKTGVKISPGEFVALSGLLLAKPPDEKAASDLMAKMGISPAMEELKELVARNPELIRYSREACREAATIAAKLGVPLVMHNSPTTKSQVRDFAKDLKGLLIAAHSNYTPYKPQEAIEVTRAVKKAGGWVDIIGGDFFGPRLFFPNHATTLALLAEGLVDTMSTDYMGGHWDPILRVLEYAVLQNVIDLPQAIALATGNVTKAIPNVAPNRGQIAEDKIADLVILSPKSISEVRTVIIGGKVVVDEGKIVPSPA